MLWSQVACQNTNNIISIYYNIIIKQYEIQFFLF